MIGVTIALLLIGWDGRISRIEGIGMVVFLSCYISFLIKISRSETKRAREAAVLAAAELAAEDDEPGQLEETEVESQWFLFLTQS